MIQLFKNILDNLRQSFSTIFFNPITNVALAIGTILSLLADQIGQGYYLIFAFIVLCVLYGIFVESQKYDFYKHDAIPLPIVINISNPANSNNALQSLVSLIETDHKYKNHKNNLDQYLNIIESDLIFNYSQNIYDREMLIAFLQILRHDLEKLKRKTPKNTVLYLAYIGPVSVAILIGTLLGTDGVKIFQYNKSSDSYYAVAEVIDRKLKADIQVFEKFEITKAEKQQDKVTVAIDAASHQINLQNDNIQQYGDIILLKHKGNGTISPSEDWLQYSREIFKILNLAQQNNYKEIKLVYSMPNALGILLGMAVQQYWPILLTQYENAIYQDLINLQDVKLYRGQ